MPSNKKKKRVASRESESRRSSGDKKRHVDRDGILTKKSGKLKITITDDAKPRKALRAKDIDRVVMIKTGYAEWGSHLLIRSLCARLDLPYSFSDYKGNKGFVFANTQVKTLKKTLKYFCKKQAPNWEFKFDMHEARGIHLSEKAIDQLAPEPSSEEESSSEDDSSEEDVEESEEEGAESDGSEKSHDSVKIKKEKHSKEEHESDEEEHESVEEAPQSSTSSKKRKRAVLATKVAQDE